MRQIVRRRHLRGHLSFRSGQVNADVGTQLDPLGDAACDNAVATPNVENSITRRHHLGDPVKANDLARSPTHPFDVLGSVLVGIEEFTIRRRANPPQRRVPICQARVLRIPHRRTRSAEPSRAALADVRHARLRAVTPLPSPPRATDRSNTAADSTPTHSEMVWSPTADIPSGHIQRTPRPGPSR